MTLRLKGTHPASTLPERRFYHITDADMAAMVRDKLRQEGGFVTDAHRVWVIENDHHDDPPDGFTVIVG